MPTVTFDLFFEGIEPGLIEEDAIRAGGESRDTFLPHNVYANMRMGAEMLALLAMTGWFTIGGGEH